MTTRRLFIVILFCALFGIAATEANDPDMWWHLRTGELILRDGIPRQDVFSFSVPGREWITHEWLSQVFLWVVYSAAGLGGLIVAFGLIITLSWWLVYLRCEGRPYVAGFVLILSGATASGLWGSRPQMFNLLFLALYLFIVEGYRQRSALARAAGHPIQPRALWLLPLLTVLWVNFHSGYLLGVVLLATYAAGDAIQRLVAPGDERALSWSEIRWLAAMTVACFLAALLNPNGYELWIYPFLTLGSPVMQQRIVEWFSPDFHNPYNWPFALMLALGLVGFVWSRKRPTWTDLLLFMGTGFAGMVSVRHIPLFSLVAAPILCRAILSSLEGSRFYPVLSGTEPREPTPRPMAALNAAVALLVLLFPMVRYASQISTNAELVVTRYPAAAVAFLEQSGLIEQRGFNSYNWGGYLIWRGIPVFVDGRADVYGDDFLNDYFMVTDLRQGWQEPLEAFDIRYVLMEDGSRLAVILATTEGWREVYRDDLAVIFEREGG